MDILRKEVNRFGVENTLRQLKDYHSSLRVKKTKQLRFLNRQTMKFGTLSSVAATITRRKTHMSRDLDRYMVKLNRDSQRNPDTNIQSHIKKNFMNNYTKEVVNNLMKSVYINCIYVSCI